jgi:hypothetical protein
MLGLCATVCQTPGGWPTHRFRISLHRREMGCPTRRGFRRVGTTDLGSLFIRRSFVTDTNCNVMVSVYYADSSCIATMAPHFIGISCDRSSAVLGTPTRPANASDAVGVGPHEMQLTTRKSNGTTGPSKLHWIWLAFGCGRGFFALLQSPFLAFQQSI